MYVGTQIPSPKLRGGGHKISPPKEAILRLSSSGLLHVHVRTCDHTSSYGNRIVGKEEHSSPLI